MRVEGLPVLTKGQVAFVGVGDDGVVEAEQAERNAPFQLVERQRSRGQFKLSQDQGFRAQLGGARGRMRQGNLHAGRPQAIAETRPFVESTHALHRDHLGREVDSHAAH